jgi:hypothetical protein
MSNIPNKHVQAYHIRQAYVEVLKRGYIIVAIKTEPNEYTIRIGPAATYDSQATHVFKLRPHDE